MVIARARARARARVFHECFLAKSISLSSFLPRGSRRFISSRRLVVTDGGWWWSTKKFSDFAQNFFIISSEKIKFLIFGKSAKNFFIGKKSDFKFQNREKKYFANFLILWS